MIEIMKAILFGIIEGVTEWLPISSTGHMILLDEFIRLNVTPEFKEMFLVVIQLGAILAVLMLYWNTIFPFNFSGKGPIIKKETMTLWYKIIVACIPAAVIGLKFEDQIDALFYNYQTVSLALIVFGIFFIVIENRNRSKKAVVSQLGEITYKMAFIVGVFQLIAAVFPGTSRSGATIVGGLLIGMSRGVAAEFTFLLAVPVMFGASFLKLVKFGFHFTSYEMTLLLTGMVVAFAVSVFVIKFLMGYIKKHDFKVFGWYRIVLGIAVLLYFMIAQ
ncbi:MAG: undecaprenyl-diphosphatase [Clostridiales bacterium]|jgi:undecaprenyl-diphosphatase|nr:undecaprenyl-diphosphatase [Clostridiales bacterium]